jgi:uncharacterized protein YndB with AHSA1/START domain
VTRIAVSTEISAPPAEVWRVVEPIEHHVDWMHDAVAIRFETDQTRGVGTTFVCDTRVGPIRLADRMTITDWVDGQVMGVAHSGIVTGSGRFTLTPLSTGGTRFAWEEDLRFPWYLGGRLGEAIGGRLLLGALWRRNLRNLKALVEARGAPGQGR